MLKGREVSDRVELLKHLWYPLKARQMSLLPAFISKGGEPQMDSDRNTCPLLNKSITILEWKYCKDSSLIKKFLLGGHNVCMWKNTCIYIMQILIFSVILSEVSKRVQVPSFYFSFPVAQSAHSNTNRCTKQELRWLNSGIMKESAL